MLVTTGQVDGVLTDLQSVGLLNKDAPKLKAVYTSRRPFPNAPMFRILAGPKTAINAPADLKGVPIGISANTVMEYLTDRMLAGEGLKPEEIAKIEIGQIPVRFEQLMNGNIQAAALPDPLAQGAIAAGAKLIVDDSKYADLSQSVLTFTTETLIDQARHGQEVPGRLGEGRQRTQRASREIPGCPDRAGSGAEVHPGHVQDAPLPRPRRPQ